VILVDTSVWIDHLRSGDEQLTALLNSNQVMGHPFVLGELACGNLQNRAEFLVLMADLPQAVTASDTEVLFFIEQHQLMGRGTGAARLWTRDQRLATLAGELGIHQG
jgi:predicted nucleic acid-binding protein